MRCKKFSPSRLATFVGCLFTFAMSGQQELGLSFLKNEFQSTFVNPAFFPEKRWTLALPGFVADGSSSADVGLREVFPKNEDGSTTFDVDKLLAKLEAENNTVKATYGLETIGLCVKTGKNAWLLTHSQRTAVEIGYPRNLVDLLWNGNAKFIGQTIEIGPSLHAAAWQEFGLGFSTKRGPITVGGRAKMMLGAAAIRTDRTHISLHTSDDIYQLKLETDYGFQSAGEVLRLDTSGFGFDPAVSFPTAKKVFGKNRGFGLDLGARFNLGEKVAISASVLDLGSKITWKNEANYWLSKGTFEYDGVDLPPSTILNSDSLDFAGKLDSLNDILAFQKSATEFTTTLPARGYLTGTFSPTENWLFGATLFMQTGGEKESRQALALAARRSFFKKILSVGLHYSLDDRSVANLGATVGVRVPFFRIFATSDNVFSSVLPKQSSRVQFRIGASLSI